MSPTLTLRRWLPALLALLVTVLALVSASSALAIPDCDLTPDAPICNRGDEPPGGGGGKPPGGGGSTTAPTVFTASRTDSVGAGQFMSTTTTVNRASATISSTTRTWTSNAFWGFRGCVTFDLVDGGGSVMRRTPPQCFGVDGIVIGRADRTDSFVLPMAPNEAAAIRAIRINHS